MTYCLFEKMQEIREVRLERWLWVHCRDAEKAGQPGSLAPQGPKRPKCINFPLACSEIFDRTRFLPYTSVFVRDAFTLSGAAPACSESLSWKGIIFGPGTK